MRKKILNNILLLIVSFLIIIFVCEVIFRLYIYFQKPIYRKGNLPILEWELTPGAEMTRKVPGEGVVTYLINQSGFRDSTNKAWKEWTNKDIKIAFIGDSVTFGTKVNYEDSYCAKVEDLFYRDNRYPVKTINLAIPSTNTLDQLDVLRYKAFRLKPDIVILGYFINDTQPNRKPDRFSWFRRYVKKHFLFLTFLNSRVNNLLEDMTFSVDTYSKKVVASYETKSWQDTKEFINSMKTSCKDKGIKFAIVCFPLEGQINAVYPDLAQRKISEFCSQEKIPFLDMLGVYKTAPRGKKLFINQDPIHLNKLGHYLTAQAIYSWIVSEPVFKTVFPK